jgi:hypothetical protein
MTGQSHRLPVYPAKDHVPVSALSPDCRAGSVICVRGLRLGGVQGSIWRHSDSLIGWWAHRIGISGTMNMMMKTALVAVAAVALAGLVAPAFADQTGLHVTHDLRKERGHLCFADHYHYGSSLGLASRKAAEFEAVKSWSGFVDLEYGSDWAHWVRASSKQVDCSQSTAGWGCSISARPCR